jgi:glycosyltransferase involved in cell wall biosynthesis
MRVLISTSLFYPSKLGGPANTLYWLAKGLISQKIDVSVVSMHKRIDDSRISPDKWIVIDGIKARYCNAKTKFAHKVIRNSTKEIKNCDVVMLSSFHFLPCFFVGLYSLLIKKKIIWSPRGELFYSAINNNKAKFLYLKLIKFIFAKYVIFHATSTEEEKIIHKYLGGNVNTVVIPNYLELPIKENRDIPEKYLLYVGRIAPIKALDNLINGLIKSENFIKSEYKLFLAGYKQGDFYDVLKKIITANNLSDRIVFLGNIEGDEKNRLYSNAYFTFLVSHSENFGNVVLESMAQGTPVVASQGTPWQLLEQTNSGFWIKNDVEHITEYVDNILQLPDEKYESMRTNALNYCRKEFDIYANIDKWIDIIKN